MNESVLVSRDGAIATVTLSNPEKLNALGLDSWKRLGEVMRELDADKTLRCIVIRGAGEKAFAAGADIAEFETTRKNAKVAKKYGEALEATMGALSACRHPIVAMIHGACVGGGLEVASQCDLRICGTSSRFGIPINKLGLVVGYGEMKALIDLVGRAVALEILLEGRVFGAEEAKDKGLVNRVVPDDKVEEERRSLRAGTRNSRGASPRRAPSPGPSATRPTPASTPRTSKRASRRFSPRRNRSSGASSL